MTQDRTRKNIFLNLGASGFGKVSIAAIRFLQVPIFLAGLGVEDYGRWLLLSSIPAWLTLANLGFGSVAGNEISMSVSQGNISRAKDIFATCLLLIGIISIIGGTLAVLISPLIPWGDILHASANRKSELSAAAIFLSASVIVSFWGEIFGSRFRAAMKAHLGITIAAFRPWLELAVIAGVIAFTKRFDYLALGLFISNVCYLFIVWVFSAKAIPDLNFSRNHIKIREIRPLFIKGCAFQAFPLGNAVLFQGNLIIVQSLLGPSGVAVFGSARTLVRSVNQIMEMINQSIWPELSHLLGAHKLTQAAGIHRWGVFLSVSLAIMATVILALIGLPLFRIWTHAALQLTQVQLLLFLAPIPVNALWYTSSVVHAACNRHGPLAGWFITATIFGTFACYFLTMFWGLSGAAISTLCVDLILVPFVLKKSLDLTGDSPQNFRREICKKATETIQHFRKKIIKQSRP